jgi:hypothetical protein
MENKYLTRVSPNSKPVPASDFRKITVLTRMQGKSFISKYFR